MAKVSFPPLQPAIFVRRLNRFVGEVCAAGVLSKVHIASSGRMTDLLVPGAKALLKPASAGSTRSTAGTLMAVWHQGSDLWVSVDATLPNWLVEKALLRSEIKEFADHEMISREHTVGHSRFDFLLTRDLQPFLLEVKSVTHVDKGIAMFPDAPTERGLKHLKHLTELTEQGYDCGVLFIVQRSDARIFTPFREIDPEFSQQLEVAKLHGVRVLAYSCQVDETGVTLDRKIVVELGA